LPSTRARAQRRTETSSSPTSTPSWCGSSDGSDGSSSTSRSSGLASISTKTSIWRLPPTSGQRSSTSPPRSSYGPTGLSPTHPAGTIATLTDVLPSGFGPARSIAS
jgi:hypothetical protein